MFTPPPLGITVKSLYTCWIMNQLNIMYFSKQFINQQNKMILIQLNKRKNKILVSSKVEQDTSNICILVRV
jgi:hypothetical protein